MEIIIGKKYKHEEYHIYILVEKFENGYFRGLGFYKNKNNCVGIGDNNIIDSLEYNEVSDEEFFEELTKIERQIKDRIYK